jgi:RNA polymerase sigma factor (sigma-70 family)
MDRHTSAQGEFAPSFAQAAFERHRVALHRFLMQRLHNSQNAQDLAQEVYLRLLRVADGELVRNPLAFLYRIALNVVYEFRLQRDREPVMFDSDAVEALVEHPVHAPTANQPDASEALQAEARLKRVLAPLPPMMRAVFVLRKRDGKSHREIAAELGLSTHTVKKYLCQAVAQCRAAAGHDRSES